MRVAVREQDNMSHKAPIPIALISFVSIMHPLTQFFSPSRNDRIMKKTFQSAAALLIAFATVGCEPPPASTSTSTDVAAPVAADSNVTATAETPAPTETPAPAAEAPAAE